MAITWVQHGYVMFFVSSVPHKKFRCAKIFLQVKQHDKIQILPKAPQNCTCDLLREVLILYVSICHQL